jgi:glycerol-3-phosphate acyltransferase PlsY
MHAIHSIDEDVRCAPRTAAAFVFLAAFAVTMSYLVVYAMTNTLVAANIMQAFPPNADPRPEWMFNLFFVSFGVFAVVGLLVRWLSHRQIRRIDAMADAED